MSDAFNSHATNNDTQNKFMLQLPETTKPAGWSGKLKRLCNVAKSAVCAPPHKIATKDAKPKEVGACK